MRRVARASGRVMPDSPARTPLSSRRPVEWLVLPVALLASVWMAAGTWERVKTKPKDHAIQVTGSATKRIVSDLIQWSASIAVENQDRSAAYSQLKDHAAQVVAYLTAAGVAADDIRVMSANVSEQYDTEVVGTGEERVERQVLAGFRLDQRIVVSSHDVTGVEKASREVTQLLERGISISSDAPEYHYTKLGDLKIEMLAEAAKDARARAENIVEPAGGTLGNLIGADMGVININPPNSRSSSWDGNNDTTTVEKDIITIVHATFELEGD
jgi:hypothetical protein